jgi:hypothetical protein
MPTAGLFRILSFEFVWDLGFGLRLRLPGWANPYGYYLDWSVRGLLSTLQKQSMQLLVVELGTDWAVSDSSNLRLR